MTATEKVYHIYAKNECLFHSLKEEEFKVTWSALKKLVKVLDSRYEIDELSYEELIVNRDIVANSSY